MARNIAMITTLNDIELRVVHIHGKGNAITDNLSRLDHTWVQPSSSVLQLDWCI